MCPYGDSRSPVAIPTTLSILLRFLVMVFESMHPFFRCFFFCTMWRPSEGLPFGFDGDCCRTIGVRDVKFGVEVDH